MCVYVQEAFPLATFGEASNGVEAMQRLRQENWSIVILDIGLAGRDGVEILKDIRQERPHLPVLMLSMYPEEQFAVRVLKAGASGYMTKEAAADELVSAVRRIIGGEKYVSASLAQQLVTGLNRDSEAPLHDRLSDREYQVMCLLASGKSVSQIADGLSLSVKTISTHRAHILDKMQLKTNAAIVCYAVRNLLVM